MTSHQDEKPHQAHGKAKSLADALRDAIKKLPADQQKKAREVLREKGVLKDEKP